MILPIPINPRLLTMPGFSERQILEHFNVLYKGYVNKINEVREKLTTSNRQQANATYSEYRGLKKGETFAMVALYCMSYISKTSVAKADYIMEFLQNVDWNVAETRFNDVLADYYGKW